MEDKNLKPINPSSRDSYLGILCSSPAINLEFDINALQWVDDTRNGLESVLTQYDSGRILDKKEPEVSARLAITGHGETTTNVKGSPGWLSGKLTKAGIDKAKEHGANAEYDALVLTSDLPRAMEHAIRKYYSHDTNIMAELDNLVEKYEKEYDEEKKTNPETYKSIAKLALENGIIPTPLLRAQFFSLFEDLAQATEKVDETELQGFAKERRQMLRSLKSIEEVTLSENYVKFFERVAGVLPLLQKHEFKNVDLVCHSGSFDCVYAYYRYKKNREELCIKRMPTPPGRGQMRVLKLDKEYDWLNDPEQFRELINSQKEQINQRRKYSFDELIKKGKGIAPTHLAAFVKKEGKNEYEKAERSFYDLLNSDKPVLILGDGGQGKSILATEIVSKINEQFEKGEKTLSVLVHCEDMARQNEQDKLDSYFAKFFEEIPKTLLDEYSRLVYVIDGLEALSDAYRKPLLETVLKLAEKNKVIVTSRYLGFEGKEDSNPGFSTIQIDADAVAKDLDSFLEGRLEEKNHAEFKKIVKDYDSEIVGSFQNLFFLLEVYKNQDDVKKYLTDGETLSHINQHEPLTQFQLMNAKDDLMLGRYVASKPEYLKNKGAYELIKKKVIETKKRMGRLAFNELTDQEPKNGTNAEVHGIEDEHNPLLRLRPDGRYTFAHDNDRENAATRHFADELNSGRLSVQDAYKNYWSYEEKAEFWSLPKEKEWRALMPAWQNILLNSAQMLKTEKAEELAELLSRNYFEAKKEVKEYNPFLDDLRTCLRVIGKAKLFNSGIKEKIYGELASLHDGRLKELYGSADCSDFLMKLIKSDCPLRGYAFGVLGELKLQEAVDDLISVLNSNYTERHRAAAALGEIGGEKSLNSLIEAYQKNKTKPLTPVENSRWNPSLVEIIAEAILKSGDKDARKIIYEDLGKENLNCNPNSDNRCLSHAILFAISKAKPSDCAEHLINYINSDKLHTTTAMDDLEEICPEKAVPELIEYIDDKNKKNVDRALTVLGKIGDKKAISAALNYYNSVPKNSVAKEDLDKLSSAVSLLIQLGANSAIPLILESIPALSKYSNNIESIEYFMDKLDGSGHIEYLNAQLNSADPTVRLCALNLLSNSESAPSDKVRHIAKFDDSKYARNLAEKYLAKFPTEENLNVFYEILDGTPHSSEDSEGAIMPLAKSDFVRFKPKLIELSKSDNWKRAFAVALAYGKYEHVSKDPDMRNVIYRLLEHNNEIVRDFAAQACVKKEDAEGVNRVLNKYRNYQISGVGRDSKGPIISTLANSLSEEKVIELLVNEEDEFCKEEILDVLHKKCSQKYLNVLTSILESEIDPNKILRSQVESSLVDCICSSLSREWLLKNPINLNKFGKWNAKKMHECIKPQGYNPAVKKLTP